MIMKPLVAHYMNKYPGGHIDSDCVNYLRAYCRDGILRVVLCGAAGSLQDQSKLCGAKDKHDLAPIPKDCRVFCDRAEGIDTHNDAAARQRIANMVADKYEGRVPSVHEMGGDRYARDSAAVDQFRAESFLVSPEIDSIKPKVAMVVKASKKKKAS